MRASLTVDKSECRGAGLCCALAPDLFDFDDDAQGVPVRTELSTAADIEMAEAVQSGCPTQAVRVTLLSEIPG
jgi:ferredoxin